MFFFFYLLTPDNKGGSKTDRCETKGCSQFCQISKAGVATCTCKNGYTLDNDELTCLGENVNVSNVIRFTFASVKKITTKRHEKNITMRPI